MRLDVQSVNDCSKVWTKYNFSVTDSKAITLVYNMKKSLVYIYMTAFQNSVTQNSVRWSVEA